MSTLVFQVTTEGAPDYAEYGEIDGAYVHVTPELCETVQRRLAVLRSLAEGDSQLYELRYWDFSCQWFHWDEEQGPPPLVADHALLHQDFTIPEELHRRTECNLMVLSVYAHGQVTVRWVAIPKHHSAYIATREVPASLFAMQECEIC